MFGFLPMLSKKISQYLLIFIGSAVWSVTMVKSGLTYSFGLGFWGPNGHDGIWHIALIRSLSQGTWEMPIYAGEILKNYHVGLDLALAFIHRFTGLPAMLLYFQIVPPLTALALGFLVYRLVNRVWGNKNAAWWSVFFLYFGGSFGWLVSLIQGRGWGGESLFWAQQSISTLINPPFAVSLVLIFSGLLSLLNALETKKINWYVWSILLFSLTSVTKIYAGIIVLTGLGLVSLYEIYTLKKFRLMIVTLVTGLFSALLFFPLNRNSSSLIHFQPFWFLETLMALSDRLGWPRFYQAMTTYRQSGNFIKAFLAYAGALALFIVGNLGSRILFVAGLSGLNKKFTLTGVVTIFLFQGIFLGILFPSLFVQEGTPWNTIQFFYYSQIFAGILAGLGLSRLLVVKKPLAVLITIIIVGVTLPTTLNSLQNYLPARPPAMVGNTELSALSTLKNLPPGRVLTYPYDSQAAIAAESNPPRPLYLYESTAYVAALSAQKIYLEDEVNLNITSYDWHTRRANALEFFNTTDPVLARSFLSKYSIQYIYLAEVARFRPKLSESQLGFTNIYENSQTAIWQKDPPAAD